MIILIIIISVSIVDNKCFIPCVNYSHENYMATTAEHETSVVIATIFLPILSFSCTKYRNIKPVVYHCQCW